MSALVFARFYKIEFNVFIFGSFFGPFFQDGLADFFSGAAFRGFSGHRNHTLLCLRTRYHTHFNFFSQTRRSAASVGRPQRQQRPTELARTIRQFSKVSSDEPFRLSFG